MVRVLRKKTNFLPQINGVAFVRQGDYSISAEIGDEMAAILTAHEGYELVEDGNANVPAAETAPPPKETAAERKERVKREAEEAAHRNAGEEKLPPDTVPQANDPPLTQNPEPSMEF